MDTNVWIILILAIALISIGGGRRKAQVIKRLAKIRQNHKEGLSIMCDVFNRFIGKECIITTMDTANVIGVVEAIEGDWLAIRAKGGAEDLDMLRIEFISRIREYPKGKNGKKKWIVT
jgi:hypothetical protein